MLMNICIMDTSITFVGLLLCTLCGSLYIAQRIRTARSSPLNAAPDANWSVKYSGLWIWWQRTLEKDALAVHQAHLKHGSVLRLAPNELSINDVDGGLKPIYTDRMPKTDVYQVANNHGQEPMVALKDEERHRERKRLLAKPHFKTSLMNAHGWHAEQEKLAEDLKSRLQDIAATQPDLDFYDLFFAWSVAAISTYIFGPGESLNFMEDMAAARRTREAYFSQRLYLFLPEIIPIPTEYLRWLGYKPEVPWIDEMLDRAETTSKSLSSHPFDTVFEFMKRNLRPKDKLRTGDEELSEKQTAILSSEMQDQIIAGVDTSMAVLTACAWELSSERNKHWQEKLRQELRTSVSVEKLQDLESLPILNAIIKESLRLYPPVAAGQPRMTSKPVSLGSFGNQITVPPSVKVSCQAYSLHRSNVFDRPEEWRPERWIDCTDEKKTEMERWFWAFGSGSRKCLGEPLGLSNLRVAVAVIWKDFETQSTHKTRLILSHGFISLPCQNKDGDYMRLRLIRMN